MNDPMTYNESIRFLMRFAATGLLFAAVFLFTWGAWLGGTLWTSLAVLLLIGAQLWQWRENRIKLWVRR